MTELARKDVEIALRLTVSVQRRLILNIRLLLDPRSLAQRVRRRLKHIVSLRAAVRSGRKRFAAHSAYTPNSVASGFAPRLSPPVNDSALLERICNAYIKAKVQQKNVSGSYKVSNEWLLIYEKQLGPVMQALANRDIGTLSHMYENFYRDPCSTGLAGLPVNMEKIYFGGDIHKLYREWFLCDALHRHELWKAETKGIYSVQSLTSPDIGNPYGFFVDGTFLKVGSDYQHFYAAKISELLQASANQVVAELGGGYGGMAYYLVRDNPNTIYINFDLPENLALSTYYLLKTFPEVPATLYGEADLTTDLLDTPRIILLPSFEIEKMPSGSVAVFFNSYSLAEMSPSTVREYLKHIGRITNRFFLHVNHTKNAVLTADEFSIEQHGFTLVERRVAGWTLGANQDADEFEFLYTKDVR